MVRRPRAPRRAFRRGRGSQAMPIAGLGRRAAPGPRARTWLGWAAVAGGVAAVAFFVGRAGLEVGLPSPTPSPTAPAPLGISFGTALDPVTGLATQLTDRFRAGDTFAYSVQLPTAPGVDSIDVEIVRIYGDSQTVVQQPDDQAIDPTSRAIAFAPSAADLLAAWGPGSYEMRIYLGAPDPLAVGRFTLVETPAAS